MPEANLKARQSYLPDIHRLLPQSPDAEQGVLTSCLLAPRDVIGLCVEKKIDSYYFHIPAHGTIYLALLDMWNAGMPVDFISLTAFLRDRGTLDQVGGAAFITALFTFLPTAANAGYYLEILEEKNYLREIIRVGTEYAARSYDEQDDVPALIDGFEQKAMAIRKIRKASTADIKTLTINVINDFQMAADNPGAIRGLTTGFPELDKMTDGLHEEEMIVIAARPSHGKTALALNIAEHIAIELKKPIAIFSLEMSAKQLVQRLLCSRARVSYFRFRDGFISERDFPAIQAAASKIASAPIYIDDTSGLSIQEMRAAARRLKSEKDVQVIIFDYLQLGTSRTKRAQDNRQIEVAEISVGCKTMARELHIPVIVLAQVDRAVEKQQRRARLSDLRESGSIEQDADTVAFLSREELYADNEEEMERLEGLANLNIAKQRHGPVGDVKLTFIKEFTRFESRASTYDHEADAQPRRQHQEPIGPVQDDMF